MTPEKRTSSKKHGTFLEVSSGPALKSAVENVPTYYKLNALAVVNNKSDVARPKVNNNSRRMGDESFFTEVNGGGGPVVIDEGSIEVNSADFNEEKL